MRSVEDRLKVRAVPDTITTIRSYDGSSAHVETGFAVVRRGDHERKVARQSSDDVLSRDRSDAGGWSWWWRGLMP